MLKTNDRSLSTITTVSICAGLAAANIILYLIAVILVSHVAYK